MGLVPLVQNKGNKWPAPKISLLTRWAGRRETPTGTLDGFSYSTFGTGPIRQAHEVSMCMCLQGTCLCHSRMGRTEWPTSAARIGHLSWGGQGARVHCQLKARQMGTLTCAQSLSKSKFDERVEAKLNTNNFH